jgi:hypothetical protein
MEPSANDFKKILRRHEEFVKANNSTLQQLMDIFREFDEIMVGLTQRMEAKFSEFEKALVVLSHRLDEMESTIQQLRAHAHSGRSVSDSVNVVRLSAHDVGIGNDTGNINCGIAPMDTEEGPQHFTRASDV